MRTRITKLCKTAFVLVFLLSASSSLLAQTSDRPNNIQLFGTALSYNGELGSQFWESTEKGGGITYNRFLSPSFDASLDFAYNTTERNYQQWQRFKGPVPSLMLGLKLKMYGTILKEDALIGPYLVAKVGGMYVNTDGMYGTTSATSVPFEESSVTFAGAGGAGIRFRITDAISVFGETTYILTGNDMVDGVSGGDNDRFLEHRGGIGINLGKSKDTDMDGVPDRRDKCPDTPTGVQVDKNGCPVDTDGDGVADYQDECPTEAGVASLNGCPDRDNDGVADKNDECPDEAGTVATKGCPDSDGDGVADKDDKCPGTPAGVQVGADGCPMDSDGDGVADNEDACPNTPGPGTANGCPEVDAATKKLIDEKVRFEFDKAIVQEAYKQLLDSVIVALEKYPDHVLLIKGHADFIGTEEYNQALSERRAEAVKEYLVQRGVKNPDRLVTRGYGESQPLVQVNQRLSKRRTETARRINRRVGFELNTPDMQLNME